MEDSNCSADEIPENCDGEEEFRSCCAEDEEWKEVEESATLGSEDDLDEFTMKIFFKGVSECEAEGSTSGVSGIGVVMERSPGLPVLQVQKKLDFYVEPSVAEHLALLDGLLEALRVGVRRVFAFTDSETVNNQIAQGGIVENQLLVALGQRIMELTDRLDAFILNLVPSCELAEPLHLAQEAAGICHLFSNGCGSFEDCSVCCEKKHSSQMVTMNCSHKFCSHCMVIYVQGKLQASQVPVRCPQSRCNYYISPSECKSFLPVDCYDSFERTLVVAEAHNLERIRCPFPNCSVLLSPNQSTTGGNSSNQLDTNCIECPECHRLVCTDCGVPWHLSMTCEEYRNLPSEERDAADITLHRLANGNNWRSCQQCGRMIERTQGCYYMTCWCGHEFCYSCGAEYRDGQQTCQCTYLDENYEPSAVLSNQDPEFWRWEFFDSPTINTYTEQERSHLALMQRFLAGGFGIGDQNTYQSPPRCSDSYIDTIKDLHQLPWLERFVSVISDNYHEDYTQ
uniref:RBR-type E3 ubiquitin transferase n=1 Tax=Anthurium amnicola TaxID=1678845 RepID=A0A1D1ZHY9_9ARAE